MIHVTENDYIRIYLKLLMVIAIALVITTIPSEEKQEVKIPVQAPVASKAPLPKIEETLPKPSIAKPVEASVQTAQPVSSGNSIEEIVRQAARSHGIDENYFVKIAKCESTLNPSSVNKSYYENGHPSGLFQHISGYWPKRAAMYGYPGASVFDATANANVTAAMFADDLQYLWECK
jgi:hypothetical protein